MPPAPMPRSGLEMLSAASPIGWAMRDSTSSTPARWSTQAEMPFSSRIAIRISARGTYSTKFPCRRISSASCWLSPYQIEIPVLPRRLPARKDR